MRAPSRRRGSERGAVMVELAIVAPLLVLLVMMGLELALVLRGQLTVSSAGRAGARVGSSAHTSRLADFDLLSAIKSGLGDIDLADVELVVVFEPDGSGNMPASCRTASVTGTCNRYTGVDLINLDVADFTGTTSCTGSSPDRFWCPATRVRDQAAAAGPDWLGVYLQIRHGSSAPAFLGDRSLSDKTVMRLEPRLTP